MVLRLEVEAARLADPLELAEVLLAADRRIGVDEVRNAGERLVEVGAHLRELGLALRDLVLEASALGDVGLPLFGRELLLAGLLVLVALPVELVELGLDGGHALLSRDGGVDVGIDAAPATALDDLVPPF